MYSTQHQKSFALSNTNSTVEFELAPFKMAPWCPKHFKPSKMFETALQSLPQFIQEMDADWEMVFDWMEDQCGAMNEEQLNEVAMIFDTTLV